MSKIFSKKQWLVLFIVVAIINVALIAIFFSTHDSAMTDAKFTLLYEPLGIWLGDVMVLWSQIIGLLSKMMGRIVVVLIAVFLVVAEILLIRKIIKTRMETTLFQKVYSFILLQIIFGLSIVSFCLIGPIVVAQSLVWKASDFVKSEALSFQIPADLLITDLLQVASSIEKAQSNIVVIENPQLSGIAIKDKKTFFESYAVPLVLKTKEPKLPELFDTTPYYFIKQNILVVRDKGVFLKDLSPIFTRKILALKYPSFITKPNPTYSILSQNQYSTEVRKARIGSFKREIAKAETIIKDNNQLLQVLRGELSGNLKQLAQKENEARIANEDTQKYIDRLNDFIRQASEDATIDNTSGNFIYPSTIIIREPVKSSNLADDSLLQYLHYITHESLHYYSNKPSVHPLSDSINEGLTDYLTLMAFGNIQKEDLVKWASYPLHVQVIDLLTQSMPLELLTKIYFSQDQEVFAQDFKKAFPLANYDEFMAKIDTIHSSWLSNPNVDNRVYLNSPVIAELMEVLTMSK